MTRPPALPVTHALDAVQLVLALPLTLRPVGPKRRRHHGTPHPWLRRRKAAAA